MESLEGKTALVTGASRGIGRACALALGRAGCAVAVNYRSRDREADETCALIQGSGGKALAFRADVSLAGEVRSLVEGVSSRLGPVDILINNAGIARKRAPLEVTEEDWDEAMTVNLKSAFLVSREVLPGMRERRWGRIVNISSAAAYTGGIVGPHYTTSKAAMHGLTRAYAQAFAREGITVNAVAPGAIETEMLIKDLGVTAPRSPVGRFGTSEEIADATMMLVRNGYMTGQTLVIGGGMYML